MQAIRPNAELERIVGDQTLLLQGVIVELRKITSYIERLEAANDAMREQIAGQSAMRDELHRQMKEKGMNLGKK